MRVNKLTMLFEEMTDEDCDQITSICEDILEKQFLPNPIPKCVMLWLEMLGYNDRHLHRSLVCDVFPSHGLLSVVKFLKSKTSSK